MMGGGGIVFIVTPGEWLRIPRDEIRRVARDREPGGPSICVGMSHGREYFIQTSYVTGEFTKNLPADDKAERYRRIVASQLEMFHDLTFHAIDIDVTWKWDDKVMFWVRTEGRPA